MGEETPDWKYIAVLKSPKSTESPNDAISVASMTFCAEGVRPPAYSALV